MVVYRVKWIYSLRPIPPKHYSVPQWVELTEVRRTERVARLINDNIGHRNIFVLLTAIAVKVPIKLLSAILVPYFKNPFDTADAFALIVQSCAA